MRILIVSDVHYELNLHHGIDESRAFDWLSKKVEATKPDSLVGLGDWGRAWNQAQWDKLTSICQISAIYGNHDDLGLMRGIENVDGSRALVTDGEIREIARLRFGFINGIVSGTKAVREGVPRKSQEEYIRVGYSLLGVEVLCTHESPYVPAYGTKFHPSPGTEAVERIIRRVRPKLALSGHLGGPYTVGKVGESLSLRVDSSQKEKHYAIIDTEKHIIQVYRDWELVEEIKGVP